MVGDRALSAGASGTEIVAASDVAGRRIARALHAAVDLPGSDNSAMDGFAVRSADAGVARRIVGESRAGRPFEGAVGPGEAALISTGAALPDGADAVVPLEAVRREGDRLELLGPVEPSAFVRRAASDIARGDLLFDAGAVVEPPMVASVVAAGAAEIEVERPPLVGVLSSGDEVVPPGAAHRADQVVDAAGPGVAAQLAAAGGRVAGVRSVSDDPSAVADAVMDFLDSDRVDLLVTIGGVSVGPHDHLRAAFSEAAVERVFWGVAVRPGHPLWFGVREEQRVLGLPGNPVSAAVCLHVFGRAALGRGEGWQRRALLAEPFDQTIDRTQLVRCRWREGALVPLSRQGSHQVTSLVQAEALARFDPAAGRVPAGAMVPYQEFR